MRKLLSWLMGINGPTSNPLNNIYSASLLHPPNGCEMMPFISLWLRGSRAQQYDRLTKASSDYIAPVMFRSRSWRCPFPQCLCARAHYKQQGKVAAGLENVSQKKCCCVSWKSPHRWSVGVSNCSPSRAPGSPAQHRSDAGGLRGTWVFQRGLSVPRHLEKQKCAVLLEKPVTKGQLAPRD